MSCEIVMGMQIGALTHRVNSHRIPTKVIVEPH